MNTPLLIIGAGPGGYVAAFHAADLGMNVVLVDREPHPGGVCLYRGCIPSKALLHAAKILDESKAAKHIGIEFGEPKINLDQLKNWKNNVLTKLIGGLEHLRKQRKIQYIQGKASFLNSNSISIENDQGDQQTLSFEKAILATGSRPVKLPHLPDSPRILNSTTALNLDNIPKNLLVIGGGYIGLELGTVYAALGSKVDVVEMTPGLLPGADRDLVRILEKRLKNTFQSIILNTKVIKAKKTSNGILITFEDKKGKTINREYEKVLSAVGRKPNSDAISLKNTKVETDTRGFVKVNAQRQTTDPSIYAIGDIAGEPMLAHKASHEGRVAVEAVLGKKTVFEPKAIPAVIFTDPEIAWCGLTQTQAEEENRNVKIVTFPWGTSGRALTLNRTDGLTKLLIDPETERILGVAIVGAGAGELIAEGVLAIEMGTVAEDMQLTIHPHPTLSETMMESAEMFFGQSTHIYRPKK